MGIPAEILSVDGLGLTLKINGAKLELAFCERSYVNTYEARFDGKCFWLERSEDVLKLVERLAEGDKKFLILSDLAALTSYPTQKRLLEDILRDGNSLTGVMRTVIRSLPQQRRHSWRKESTIQEAKQLLKKCLGLFPEKEVNGCLKALEELQIKAIARELGTDDPFGGIGMILVMKRTGERKDYVAIFWGERERWVRVFNIALLMEIYKHFGKRLVVKGGTMLMKLDDGAKTYVRTLMSLNPHKSKNFHWTLGGAKGIRQLDEIVATVVADEIRD